jgi:hypothetical protein
MTIKCSTTLGPILDGGSVEHGFNDKAGRSVGYQWTIRQVTYTELTEENAAPYRSYRTRSVGQPMLVFKMNGSPTRDGNRYGPAFNDTEFATLEEARRHAVKRVEQARKRDAKKFTA